MDASYLPNLSHQTGRARWGRDLNGSWWLADKSLVPTRQARWGQERRQIVKDHILEPVNTMSEFTDSLLSLRRAWFLWSHSHRRLMACHPNIWVNPKLPIKAAGANVHFDGAGCHISDRAIVMNSAPHIGTTKVGQRRLNPAALRLEPTG